MAKLKLPEALKAWKVVSALPDKNGYPSYNVILTEFDGTKTKAVMTVIDYEGDDYNSDNVDFITEETAFVKNVIKLHGVSNYIDAVVDNKPAKSKITLYLLTQDLPSFAESSKGKTASENEILDFGLKISEQLDKLEQNNILHGNLKPENIYVTPDGNYLLGGFTAFENNAQDIAFAAPEIVSNAQPDYTTDIYSLGLMMYTMANDGKLPFENEANAAEAVEKRLSKAPVSAPANGSEKLKSVIVIACQPENKNRWKNAGNIKNALSSIKSELPVQAQPSSNVIIPESTDFESNVFEEFAFDEPEEPQASEQENSKAPAVAAAAAASAILTGAAVTGAAAQADTTGTAEAPAEAINASEQPVQPKAPEAKPSPVPENEIDNRVFDEYEVATKVFNINDAVKNGEKDYGDFFDEEPVKEEAPAVADPVAAVFPQTTDDHFNDNAFYGTPQEDEPEQEQEKTNRTGIIALILVILAILLGLAAYGVFAYQNSWFPFNGNSNSSKNTTEATAADNAVTPAATEAASAPATTAPSTSSTAPTGADSTAEIYPVDVTGFFYDYATDVLEAQGYAVVRNYEYNNNVDEGIVYEMSADINKPLAKGSTITLTVSKGSESGNRTSDESSSDSENRDESRSDSDSGSSDNGNEGESNSDSDSGESVEQTAQTRNSAAPSSNTRTAAISTPAASGNSNNTSYMRVSTNSSDTANSFSPYKNNTSYLTEDEVNKMSREELNYALNEIYARRGRIFQTASLASYFNSQSWYKPLYNEAEFYDNIVFNDYESKNVDLIRKVQEQKGYY